MTRLQCLAYAACVALTLHVPPQNHSQERISPPALRESLLVGAAFLPPDHAVTSPAPSDSVLPLKSVLPAPALDPPESGDEQGLRGPA